MRQARQTLAQAANYVHPYYWAGFGVYAVPRAGRRGFGSGPGNRVRLDGDTAVLLGLSLAVGWGLWLWSVRRRRRSAGQRQPG